jgi:hypothetical protein
MAARIQQAPPSRRRHSRSNLMRQRKGIGILAAPRVATAISVRSEVVPAECSALACKPAQNERRPTCPVEVLRPLPPHPQ